MRPGPPLRNRPESDPRSLSRQNLPVDLFGWLTTIWDVASLRVVEEGLGLPDLGASGLIALVAGVSTLLGHCAILFINRVRGLRFLAVLAVGGVFLTLLYTVQALVLWIVAEPITQHRVDLAELVAVTLASTAPLAYGFLVFIPHLGVLIGRILQGWSAICLWLLVMASMSTSWWQALLTTGLAWLIMQLSSRLLGRPIGYLTGRVWTLVTGHQAFLDPKDVLAGTPFIPIELRTR